MNVLIFGRASNFGVDTIRKRHNVRHIIDISNITIPFPFNGKLYYGQEEINCSDYDCALFFQKGKTSNYIFRVLENHICVLGDPYVRSVMRDKLLSAVVMANAGLPVIESTFCSSTNHNLSLINADRIVGKPIDGAFGQGIWLSNKESVKNLIDANYILQPYIECNSSDERLHIVGGKLVCAMFRYSEKKGEFRSNIDLGGKAKNLELTEERHNIAKRIAECFPNHLIIGADILRGLDGKWYVGEVNGQPLDVIIDVTGHNFYEDVSIYIEEEAKKWLQKNS